MITGIGIDACDAAKFEKMGNLQRFLDRYMTTYEIEYVSGKGASEYMSMAGIFAAKEALVKALGTGFVQTDLKAIEVRHTEYGAPYYVTSGWIKDEMCQKKIDVIHLSITHENDMAVAIAIAENIGNLSGGYIQC
ncbi:MAG: holo-ACP synthase [Lachnospiraceae bacterium]|nr:holo-ACP synthase [Lachnospiraceae bacterium]